MKRMNIHNIALTTLFPAILGAVPVVVHADCAELLRRHASFKEAKTSKKHTESRKIATQEERTPDEFVSAFLQRRSTTRAEATQIARYLSSALHHASVHAGDRDRIQGLSGRVMGFLTSVIRNHRDALGDLTSYCFPGDPLFPGLINE